MSYLSIPHSNSNQALFSLCNQRKHQRYTTSQGTPIELMMNDKEPSNSLKGMITDDSFSGCGLIIFGDERLCLGQLCFIKIKGLDPITCEISWIRSVDKNIFRVGIQYVMNEPSKINLANPVT